MKRHNRIFLAIPLFLLAAVLAWHLIPSAPPEPRYQGQTVQYWLSHARQLGFRTEPDSPTTLMVTPTMDSNAVPYLIKALGTRRGPWRRTYRRVWNRMPVFIAKRLPAPDENFMIRGVAAFVLGNLGNDAKPAIPALIQALKEDEDSSVRISAVRALRYVGENEKPAVDALAGALKDKDDNVRAYAVIALGIIGTNSPIAAQGLIQSLKGDANIGVRGNAAQALGGFPTNDPRVTDALIEALKDNDASLRLNVAFALGRPEEKDKFMPGIWAKTRADTRWDWSKTRAAPEPGLFGQTDEPVWRAAKCDPKVWQALLEALTDNDQRVRHNATWSLKKLDPDAAAMAGVK